MDIRDSLKKITQVTAAFLLMGTGIGSAQAVSVITNGSFENAGTSSEFEAWVVESGGVARGNSGGTSDLEYAAYFNPGGTSNGTLTQTFDTTVGIEYLLEFDFGVWGTGTHDMRVQVQRTSNMDNYIEEIVSATGSGSPINPWVTYDVDDLGSFVALDTQTILRFTDLATNIGSIDTALDRVSVNPVPLPPAVWLLGSAIFGLLAIGKRKRQSLTG